MDQFEKKLAVWCRSLENGKGGGVPANFTTERRGPALGHVH
jgi:hypothetical protein